MSSRNIVLVIVMAVLGLTVVYLKDYFTSAPEAQVVQQPVPNILVAKRSLNSGAFVNVQNDLEWQPAPPLEKKMETDPATGTQVEVVAENPDYLYEGKATAEEFAGAVVRRSIRAGEPITGRMLMKSGEGGFMSAVLEPGKRAVSISVNPISGNAGFVSPGDKVDLLITYHTKSEFSKGIDAVATETFIRDVRVLAVDQSLENPENKAILAKTITVEVTPPDAEKISVAAEIGKISVALVSTGVADNVYDKAVASKSGYTMSGDISSLLQKQEVATSKVRVLRADKEETLEFYQEQQ